MDRVDKFQHTEKMKKDKDALEKKKSALLASLRTVFAGWSDDDLAILFPHLSGVLKGGNAPKDG